MLCFVRIVAPRERATVFSGFQESDRAAKPTVRHLCVSNLHCRGPSLAGLSPRPAATLSVGSPGPWSHVPACPRDAVGGGDSRAESPALLLLLSSEREGIEFTDVLCRSLESVLSSASVGHGVRSSLLRLSLSRVLSLKCCSRDAWSFSRLQSYSSPDSCECFKSLCPNGTVIPPSGEAESLADRLERRGARFGVPLPAGVRWAGRRWGSAAKRVVSRRHARASHDQLASSRSEVERHAMPSQTQKRQRTGCCLSRDRLLRRFCRHIPIQPSQPRVRNASPSSETATSERCVPATSSLGAGRGGEDERPAGCGLAALHRLERGRDGRRLPVRRQDAQAEWRVARWRNVIWRPPSTGKASREARSVRPMRARAE